MKTDWPQIIWLVLQALGLSMNLYGLGANKKRGGDLISALVVLLVTQAITMFLLIEGGFF